MGKDKYIIDSVHGNIQIEERFVTTILNTPEFQRLRRVEQTSIRSIFPTARHDRFVHSLGVYHIGKTFYHYLKEELLAAHLIDDVSVEKIGTSYLIACLLHDIAHAPFSHTFESYYMGGRKEALFQELSSSNFIHIGTDMVDVDSVKHHEYASAIEVCKKFGYKITTYLNGDVDLICRMIIGCKYLRGHEIENCFIQLLNGAIADADRLDYACRDVWASGYATSSIDIKRIARAIHIKPNKDGKLVLCYDANAMTEIFNMLDVRHFQNKYVITHHTVQYDQALLVRAAELMAKHILKKRDGSAALSKIISIESVIGKNTISNSLKLSFLCDDDIVYLLKQDKNNPYYTEYSTRQYTRFALWKTPADFYQRFPFVPTNARLTKDLKLVTYYIKQALKTKVDPNDIIICKVEYDTYKNPKETYLVVNDEVVKYKDVYPQYFMPEDMQNSEISKLPFYFVYIPKNRFVDDAQFRNDLCKELEPYIKKLYYPLVSEKTKVLKALSVEDVFESIRLKITE